MAKNVNGNKKKTVFYRMDTFAKPSINANPNMTSMGDF
jgi:hypothetical protein